MQNTTFIIIGLVIAYFLFNRSEGYRLRGRTGCGPGKVWDGTTCKYSMRAAGVPSCGPGLVWDPVAGNCNNPAYLAKLGVQCVGGKVWDGTQCRYPSLEATGNWCPDGTTWNTTTGRCEFQPVVWR